MNCQIYIDGVTIAISAFSIAAGILALSPVPAWVLVASAVGYIASAVLSLGLWAVNDLYMNKNPFDPSSCSVIEAVHRRLSAAAQHCFTQIRGIFPIYNPAPVRV